MARKRSRVEPRLASLAQAMRKADVPAERQLWASLRDRSLGGFKFRRQHAVASYIADFYCAEAKIVVELDGESHLGREGDDAARTAHLNDLGIAVVRVWNTDVYENLEGVLEMILEACESRCQSKCSPSPLPSPPSTRERE